MTENLEELIQEFEQGTEPPNNINIRDSEMRALFALLEQRGELAGLIDEAADRLDVEVATVSKSQLARLLLRVGLMEIRPDLADDLRSVSD